jgi:hypothetical protein
MSTSDPLTSFQARLLHNQPTFCHNLGQVYESLPMNDQRIFTRSAYLPSATPSWVKGPDTKTVSSKQYWDYDGYRQSPCQERRFPYHRSGRRDCEVCDMRLEEPVEGYHSPPKTPTPTEPSSPGATVPDGLHCGGVYMTFAEFKRTNGDPRNYISFLPKGPLNIHPNVRIGLNTDPRCDGGRRSGPSIATTTSASSSPWECGGYSTIESTPAQRPRLSGMDKGSTYSTKETSTKRNGASTHYQPFLPKVQGAISIDVSTRADTDGSHDRDHQSNSSELTFTPPCSPLSKCRESFPTRTARASGPCCTDCRRRNIHTCMNLQTLTNKGKDVTQYLPFLPKGPLNIHRNVRLKVNTDISCDGDPRSMSSIATITPPSLSPQVRSEPCLG